MVANYVTQTNQVDAPDARQTSDVSSGFRSKLGGETVLIFRIGSLGDTIVALPCFHLIANSFPDSRRIVITNTPTSSKVTSVQGVLDGSKLIHGTIYFPPPPRKWRDIWTLRNCIRQTGATTLIYLGDRTLMQTLRDICFFRACGIRYIVGAPLVSDLRYPRSEPATGNTERETERLARCLSPLGPIDLNDPSAWDLRLKSPEICAADLALSPLRGHAFIAVSPGGMDNLKDWGDDNWSTLLRMAALRNPNLGLVFVGSSDEFDRCANLSGQWSGPVVNLCGQLAPRASAAVLQRAIFYLGHDCGPMHLAATVGTPCIALFGETSRPKQWHPMGAHHRVIHNICSISRIEPRNVMSAIEEMLSEISDQLNGDPTLIHQRKAFIAE